ncbi:MAG TPA: hypothetical protein VEG39_12610 [Clostridia bacterium]|nr:hypothetical protein [Clostridia bacterium]
MLKKKKNYLKQIYRMNTDTNTFIIDISLDSYNEIFNGWDPSPIKRRDLDPDLRHFMDECASDIPLKYPLELQFYLPEEQYDEEKEKLTRIGIENNFNFIVHFINKEIRQISGRIVFYIIIAFAFLSVGYLSSERVTENIVTTTLMEGLSIGGWVFLWEAFSLFFFSRQEVYGRLKIYKRYQDAKVNFSYK